jgi:hypothetical protein
MDEYRLESPMLGQSDGERISSISQSIGEIKGPQYLMLTPTIVIYRSKTCINEPCLRPIGVEPQVEFVAIALRYRAGSCIFGTFGYG